MRDYDKFIKDHDVNNNYRVYGILESINGMVIFRKSDNKTIATIYDLNLAYKILEFLDKMAD